MKKGIAINSLAIMILMLITLMILIYVIFAAKSEGGSLIDNFFGFLAS